MALARRTLARRGDHPMMGRPPVSIIILAWNAWGESKACLDSLYSTLGPEDEVIVVDNGSRDATPQRLREYQWVQVIRNEENRGFAGGCNQGAVAATSDILVFLNNDTVLSGSWIDLLAAPLVNDRAVASGPRSNFVSGPQLVPDPWYIHGGFDDLQRFVAGWEQVHANAMTEVPRLVGFCLAVRASSFWEVGGFDEGYEIGGYEDDDLCRRLRDAGGSLVIAHGSYVHHTGHRTFDANEVDWAAQELHNRARFLGKFADLPTGADTIAKEPAIERSGTVPVALSSGNRVLSAASSLLASGEAERAADLALSLLDDEGAVEALLPEIVVLLHDCGRPMEELAGHIKEEALRPFLGRVVALGADRADVVLEALVSSSSDTLAVLAAAASVAGHLPVERAMAWSARLRAAGLPDACPLVSDAMTERSCVDRARAAAAALRLFGDERGRERFEMALEEASPAERAAIEAEAAAICPELVDRPAKLLPTATIPGASVRRVGRGLAVSARARSGEAPAFVIHAPWPYSNRAASVRALYVLGDSLRERGARVAVAPLPCEPVADPDPHGLPLASTWREEERSEAVHVYPEIVPGNPAGARKVIRWYLGPPRFPGCGSELEFAWSPHLKPDAERLLVNVIELDVFVPQRTTKAGVLVWFGKSGGERVELPSGFRAVREEWLRDRAVLAGELRRAELLVSYDAFASIVLEATLCGTPVLLGGDSGRTLGAGTVFGTLGVARNSSELSRALSELPEARAQYLQLCEAMAGDVDRLLARVTALAD